MGGVDGVRTAARMTHWMDALCVCEHECIRFVTYL